MAFVPPTFNLVCKIWDKGVPVANPPRNPAQVCQLRVPHSINFVAVNIFPINEYIAAMLLLPANTDIRDDIPNSNIGDTVECPSGSGRYYEVFQVDDVGKGFLNEYRIAYIGKSSTIAWPVPIP